jgi:cutinase
LVYAALDSKQFSIQTLEITIATTITSVSIFTMQLSFWALLSFLGFVLAAPVQLDGRGQSLNTFLDTILNNLPVLNCSIQKAAGILTAFENFLAFITFEATTYNQLNSKCKDYTVIFARGTTEPGNVGILVGPPFFKALTSKLGSKTLAIQGVNNYAATIPNYLVGGDPSGSQNM